MFTFSRSGARSLFPQFSIVLICLAVASASRAQGDLDVLWQTNAGGHVLAFSGSGKMLLVGTKLFHSADGAVRQNFVLPYNGSGPNSVALSPDDQYAAIGIQSFNQNLDLFRVSDGALLAGRISAHANGTTSVAFSPDGQLLATGGRDGTAKLWHVPDMTLLRTLNGGVGYRPRVFAVAFSLDGETLAVGGQGGVVFYRVADGEFIRELQGAASTLALSVSPDNQFIASVSNVIDQEGQCVDCAIKTWRLADGALLEVIDGENNTPVSIDFSADALVIAAGSEDRFQGNGLIRFWSLSDGQLLRSFHYNSGTDSTTYVTGFSYSPDGTLVAYSATDSQVVVARNPFKAGRLSIGHR